MLIGLYLLMPFFSAWIEKQDKTLTHTYIILWGCSLMLPYLTQLISPDLFGVCAWNSFGTFYYFSGYIVTYTGFSTLASKYSYEQAPELLEMFWQFCSPNVVIMAIGMFIALQRVRITAPRLQAALANVTKCGFGSYLMHYIFIGPTLLVIMPLGLPTPLCVICSVAIVFAMCMLLTNIIYKVMPRAARYIVG